MRRVRSSGFTLIELVIALGIFGIVMTVAYLSLTSITEAKQTLDDTRDVGQVADAVLSRMTRELQLAFAGIPIMPPPDRLNAPNSAKVNLIGEEDTLPNGLPGDSVTFLAMEGGQYLPDGGAHSGVVQISYRVQEDPEQSGSNREATYYLVRQETPYTRPFDKAYQKTMVFPITRDLVSLQFQYLDKDGQSWTGTWGKDNKLNLPQLVRFSLQIRTPRGAIETFTTTVPLRSKA